MIINLEIFVEDIVDPIAGAGIPTDVESLRYKLSEVEACTNNFSFQNIVGQGGFGSVYKVLFCSSCLCSECDAYKHLNKCLNSIITNIFCSN